MEKRYRHSWKEEAYIPMEVIAQMDLSDIYCAHREILKPDRLKSMFDKKTLQYMPSYTLRDKKRWLEDYIKLMDRAGEILAGELDLLDPVKDAEKYKKIDKKLSLIGDTVPVSRSCLSDIEQILLKRSGSLFSTVEANKKALSHGGVYNSPDTTSYIRKCGFGIIRGISL